MNKNVIVAILSCHGFSVDPLKQKQTTIATHVEDYSALFAHALL